MRNLRAYAASRGAEAGTRPRSISPSAGLGIFRRDEKIKKQPPAWMSDRPKWGLTSEAEIMPREIGIGVIFR
ncbi:hypothetical protein GWI33_021837 [Rhynchophorus ferrugineus]|uniref:Uncharacterized protein n=1 Tax=Rhynchophorus ferrugineus TaxID=354439 RepID=A0A834MIB4_RHYFE|nr:hypothetical protein GWI33_021837 [Rhynchophorus ferrugineus]